MKKKSGYFDKFTKKKSNAAIKEQFKQEKRKLKKEREEYFDQKRAEIRKQKAQRDKEQGTRDKVQGTRNKIQGTDDKQPASTLRPFDSRSGRSGLPSNTHPSTPLRASNNPSTSTKTKKDTSTPLRASTPPSTVPGTKKGSPTESKASNHPSASPKAKSTDSRFPTADSHLKSPDSRLKAQNSKLRTQNSLMPLNKFIAHSGVAGRREAAEIVKQGNVKVNNIVVTEPGHKVSAQDEIKINGKKVFLAKNLVYILLNKPKDYITTTDDPQGRKTVLDLTRRATTERIYPVGRLDRNTSGVLLLTNDGELSQKLTHPSNEIKKVYHVTLNKPLEKKDFEQILKGVVLEDGPASVDVLAYADIKDKTQIGVEIHSGRNRIVRRIFEALGYDVKNLDRVIFAGLTKKNIERGKWRFLSEKEVRDLKHFKKGR